jgi:hypothetical protein
MHTNNCILLDSVEVSNMKASLMLSQLHEAAIAELAQFVVPRFNLYVRGQQSWWSDSSGRAPA